MAVILLTAFIFLYMRQYIGLGESIPIKGIPYLDEWKEMHPMKREVGFMYYDRISSPITYGIFNPKIVFPRNMNFDDTDSLGHILRHEYIHIRNFDNLWKIVVMTAVCIHWFNPLAWVMWRCFNRDMELACDQDAVRGMGKTGRAAYAMTLLRFAEEDHKISLICNGFGKSAVKERILEVMKMSKKAKTGIVCSIFVMAVSMTVFASPVTSQTSGYHTENKSPAQVFSETARFKEYEAVGLYYDSVLDWISYNSRGVGYFTDELPDGTFNRMNDLAGSISMAAERGADGSLVTIEEITQEQMSELLQQTIGVHKSGDGWKGGEE